VGIQITRVDHVQITAPPARLAATVAFYRDVLGLEEIVPRGGKPTEGPAWFRCGPMKVHVSSDPAAESGQDGAKRHVCFVVADLAETERAIRERGIAVLPDERPVRGWPRIYVRDPAGNRLELACPVIG